MLSASRVAVENGNRSPISVDVERAVGKKGERRFPDGLLGVGEALREILGSNQAA